jgi:hypothetical protein
MKKEEQALIVTRATQADSNAECGMRIAEFKNLTRNESHGVRGLTLCAMPYALCE